MQNKLLVYLVYHSETEFVQEAVNSLLDERTFVKFDMVVIDTSTCDEASKVLSDVVPPEIKIIKRRGILTEIVNFVFETYLKDYEYIVRLDADDIFIAGAIEKMLAVLENDQLVGAVYGGWKLIDSQSNYIADVDAPGPLSFQGFHGACTVFRSSALKRLIFKELEITSQDGFAIYMHLYSLNWKICALPEATFKYRRHTLNLSSNKSRLWASRLKVLRYYLPNPSVDTSIFIDCNAENLGENDNHFITSRTAIHQITKGVLSDGKIYEDIDKDITLTKFIDTKFKHTGKSIISLNLSKIRDYYFDGLAEYLCMIGDLAKAKHVQYAYYIDTPIWHFQDQILSCINHRRNDLNEVTNKNFFMQVRGINYFNYSKNVLNENFIATNNLFTSNVEFNE